jgi:predicted ester cyclase
MASAEEQKNKLVVGQYFEALDRQDTERMGQLVSSTNYSFHFPGMPSMDWNIHKQFFAAFASAFPDFHHNIVDMVAEGDKVTVRINVTGTHKGEF